MAKPPVAVVTISRSNSNKTLFDDDIEAGRDCCDEDGSDMESDDDRSTGEKFLKRVHAEGEAQVPIDTE
ncbi:hypothetical protein SMACR_04555 [Sordaria macrospora]|uniref:WGS project CABT00000000 data, contig 2.20 n=2 Tax=Sordaria macrospora TaxID=5147 RepID=F7W1T3_SORMK|nr:uncharacterized protein SMAC_04555 [Sordaria macrospora k-hell]KAA8630061.1 hypothetical protein SMACR_04555 [Sordaria macrospora]WPJ62776.1 hypothetical protein SMAC4_04555 [Sordaria macrospora]CCC11568.1 unnamed protein product [Sordaria macrospora k-hell]